MPIYGNQGGKEIACNLTSLMLLMNFFGNCFRLHHKSCQSTNPLALYPYNAPVVFYILCCAISNAHC